MTDAAARAHEIFDPIAETVLAREGVDIGPMFGAEGLRVRGKVFAFLIARAGLVLKLPRSRVDELVADGAVERMVMRERPLREWVVVATDRDGLWAPLTEEAFDYLDEITP